MAESIEARESGDGRPENGGQTDIPRVIHWLWLGTAPIPDVLTYYLDTWRQHHPTWETRLWRDEMLPALPCYSRVEGVTGFKRRYDVFRLEIVREHGGVIVDMDVEAIRPIDPLLAGVTGFVGRVNANHVGNQVLGAVAHHPFFEEAAVRFREAPASASASETVGKAFLRQLLADRPDGMTVFPPETFHFQPSFDPPRRPESFPAVYAVHHELATYASPPEEGEVEEAIANLMSAAVAAREGESEERLARLHKQETRLRRAVARQARGYEALLRRVEAAREQAEARLRHAGRTR